MIDVLAAGVALPVRAAPAGLAIALMSERAAAEHAVRAVAPLPSPQTIAGRASQQERPPRHGHRHAAERGKEPCPNCAISQPANRLHHQQRKHEQDPGWRVSPHQHPTLTIHDASDVVAPVSILRAGVSNSATYGAAPTSGLTHQESLRLSTAADRGLVWVKARMGSSHGSDLISEA
jgi:hypothetical protein